MKYANERIQGGGPIIHHQAVAMDIAEMYQILHAGRTLCGASLGWRYRPSRSCTNALDQGLCTEAALKICLTAMEIFGGSGVMRELPMQKFVRDAMVFQHMDGTNKSTGLKSAGFSQRDSIRKDDFRDNRPTGIL
jgi:acyl-CoA dehydrogenase